jgi:hypothetical protein
LNEAVDINKDTLEAFHWYMETHRVSGKIKTYQIQVYMSAREKGFTQVEAAALTGFSARTGQRIEAGEHQPNRGRLRDWRSTPDPLAGVWEAELEPMLKASPGLQPMTLFEWLQERYPGKYPQVLRTLQRRVAAWKALHGDAKVVMFELRHEPGLLGLSDFTELKGIEITIAGQPFEHLLYHYRLAYSGWQYAQIIQGGESFIALSEGLQNALFACGGVPKQHRTDSLSAAYRNMGGVRNKPLTRLYDDLCSHYRLQPTRNNTGIAHENGAIESPHGHLKNRIQQALLLRGSRDFESIAQYQDLINRAVAKLNALHPAKVEEEKRSLQPLPNYRVADYEVLTARVSCRSTLDVRCVLYTVPSRLIGQPLELHLHHDRIVGYLNRQPVVALPRLRVSDKAKRRARCINYRHVAAGLRRKPRAFLYCTWQQELLPNDTWRALWSQLKHHFELDSAAVLIVEALYIAATQDKETAVADYLHAQLSASTLTLAGLRQQFQCLSALKLPNLAVTQHNLEPYDQLLCREPADQSLSEPQPAPQTTASASHAASLGNARTTSDAGRLVLRTILAGSVRIGSATPLERPHPTRPHRSPTAKRQNGFQL